MLAFQAAKFKTPADRGTAGGALSRWKVTSEDGGLTGVVTNDAPHINVLEFGSYPVIPLSKKPRLSGALTRGRAQLGGDYPPGRRTTKARSGIVPMLSPGNVSKQAPFGMIRRTLVEIQPQFIFDLGEAIDRAYQKGSEEPEPPGGV